MRSRAHRSIHRRSNAAEFKVVFQLRKLGNKRLECVEVGWIEKEINVWKALGQGLLLIGDHASCQDQRHFGALPLFANQGIEPPGYFVLGRLADDARVENDDISGSFVSVAR